MNKKIRISITIFLLIIFILITLAISSAKAISNEIVYANMNVSSAIHDVIVNDLHTLSGSIVSYESNDKVKVKIIQDKLKELGYYTYDSDCIFGEYTKLAVIDFQSANNIEKDGIVGYNTWIVLFSSNVISFEESGIEEHYLYKSDNISNNNEITNSYEVNSYNTSYYTASEFMVLGTVNFNGWKWTYYSQRVLPGGGLSIPGRYVDSDGFVCDEDGYICLASPYNDKGNIYMTPFGRYGKVYDCCGTYGVMDIYVDW